MSQLPLAVTVGFSGPRRWFSTKDFPSLDPAPIQKAAQTWLSECLRTLPAQLGMSDRHFLAAVSQIAIGGDQAFTLACQELGIPQRVTLPQPSDVYLTAVGTDGPDFSAAERAQTQALLESPHIIEERVAATAASRHLRFEEANIELVRQSDVIIAMVKDGDGGKRGGTWDVIQQARQRSIPVLVVTFHLSEDQPVFAPAWEGRVPPDNGGHRLPALPSVLESLSFESPESGLHHAPAKETYFSSIKDHCSRDANRFSRYFQSSALIIIGTHTFATACAVLALVLAKDTFYVTLAILLAVEVFLLTFGFLRHHALHKQEAASRWAMNRLLSELVRSVIAFGRYHIGFAHLKTLHLPETLGPVVRTMEILQLRETRRDNCKDWRECRDAYVAKRLTNPKGQLEFFHRRAETAHTQHHLAHRIFTIASSVAVAASAAKFLVIIYLLLPSDSHGSHLTTDILKAALGFLGVVFPVVAVAALSYSAAHDLQARAHTFTEMFEFLTNQTKLLQEVSTEREFVRLLTETEARLLGETATWYSRRSFTGVA